VEEINEANESSDAKDGTQHATARFGELKLSNIF
jgi:hypothetical protein